MSFSGQWTLGNLCRIICAIPRNPDQVLRENINYYISTYYERENKDGKETELDKLKNGIAKHKDYVFTFLSNPDVPPMNNDSEKALRPAKTKLKVSGCFRSNDGIENYATVASVIQTAIKNGQNPFEVLRFIAKLSDA